tara:strand:+ start:74 stop:406 length:333 start_codon:yes stop_codon:yes gene_type:complete
MAFKMSGWSAFTKKDDEKKVIVTDKATGKKIDKATGRPVAEKKLKSIDTSGGKESDTALEFMRKERDKGQPQNVRSIQRKVKLDTKKVDKVERSEKSKKLEEQRKAMKKQ